MKTAYSGVEGAFANIAARKIFPEAEMMPYPGFGVAYEAVEQGACDTVVLPIENCYAGDVGQVMDLIFEGSLYMHGIYSLPIRQNLLAMPGARMEDITHVISHPQALEQCGGFIRQHGLTQEQASNTAVASKYVSELGDIHTASIGSSENARLYGLNILAPDINEMSNNSTKFVVLSKEEKNITPSEREELALMFTLINAPGTLARAITVFGEHDYDMRLIHSRPLKHHQWHYYFYIEAVGDGRGGNREKMLDALRENCEMLKVLGCFEEIREIR